MGALGGELSRGELDFMAPARERDPAEPLGSLPAVVPDWEPLKGVPVSAPAMNTSGTILIPAEGLGADMGLAIFRLP